MNHCCCPGRQKACRRSEFQRFFPSHPFPQQPMQGRRAHLLDSTAVAMLAIHRRHWKQMLESSMLTTQTWKGRFCVVFFWGSTFDPFYPYTYIYLNPDIYIYISLSISLSIYLSIYLFLYLSLLFLLSWKPQLLELKDRPRNCHHTGVKTSPKAISPGKKKHEQAFL